MKKPILIPTLLAALLCMSAVVLTACTGGADNTPADTTADSVTETVAATENETVSSETEGDTLAETNADSSAQTDAADTAESEAEAGGESETSATPETDDETESETEPETAAPRYDYMEAEVLPDVTVDASIYTDMKLTLPADLQITDEDVMDYIDYIRFDYREATGDGAQVTDQPLKLGDDAFIYYKGMVDGVEFEGGSNWDDESPYQLGLGSGTFIPGFEEGLVGVIPANATKENPAEVHVTFPENYSADLAGKDAVFYVAVMYAVQYDLPEYNRDFVENTLLYEGEKDFYTDAGLLADFENYIRAYLEDDLAADVENAKLDALWTYLVEAVECRNLPQMELDFYYNSYMDEIEYYYDYYAYYYSNEFLTEYPTVDDFGKAYVGVEEGKDWKEELRNMAEKLVKKDMLIHAIAELEGIEVVTDEEYQAELDYWVEYYSGYMTEDEIIQSFGEVYLRESAFSAKMQDWLMSRAEFSFDSAAE